MYDLMRGLSTVSLLPRPDYMDERTSSEAWRVLFGGDEAKAVQGVFFKLEK